MAVKMIAPEQAYYLRISSPLDLSKAVYGWTHITADSPTIAVKVFIEKLIKDKYFAGGVAFEGVCFRIDIAREKTRAYTAALYGTLLQNMLVDAQEYKVLTYGLTTVFYCISKSLEVAEVSESMARAINERISSMQSLIVANARLQRQFIHAFTLVQSELCDYTAGLGSPCEPEDPRVIHQRLMNALSTAFDTARKME